LLGYGKKNVDAFLAKQKENMEKNPYFQKAENKARPREWVEEQWQEAKKVLPGIEGYYEQDKRLKAD
jgi:hypothetical protein